MNKIMQMLREDLFFDTYIILLNNSINAINAMNATNAINAIMMAITQFMKQNHGSSLLRLKSKRKPQI